jgi:hypothetical protein
MKLYHITKERHLSEILTRGLRINSEKSGFVPKRAHLNYNRIWGMQPIFLTDDPERITKTMLTKDWIDRHNPVVLQIELLPEERKPLERCDKVSNEFRYFDNICPSKISVTDIRIHQYL